jgi:monoamine oxidase
MLLERVGADVSLFEAKGRPGGRLHTIDEGDGVLYEAGGEWIDADHRRCVELLNEFLVEPLLRAQWPNRLLYKGRATDEANLWNDAMEDDLRVEAAARHLCRGLEEPPWSNQEAKDLDERNLDQFFREHTQSERGLWYVGSKFRSDEGDDPDRIGLLGWLSGYLHYLDRDGDEASALRVPGGFRALCQQMLDTLSAEPHFGKVLSRVRQDSGGVTLLFEDGGMAKCDHVILTLPPPALERVVFEPALSVPKRCAIEACEMSRALKIVWQFDRPWWHDHGWGGGMLCDGPLQQTWDCSLGEAAVLTTYVCGHNAVEWAKLGDPVRAGLYELAKLYPEAASAFVRGWVHNWLADPFTQGVHSHLAPGFVLGHMEHVATAEERVHFAGEHTALYQGFIEGALESAERAVEELTIV